MVTSLTTTQLNFKADDLPIKSVTVFRPSGAQIIRILKANLKVRRPQMTSISGSCPALRPDRSYCFTDWE